MFQIYHFLFFILSIKMFIIIFMIHFYFNFIIFHTNLKLKTLISSNFPQLLFNYHQINYTKTHYSFHQYLYLINLQDYLLTTKTTPRYPFCFFTFFFSYFCFLWEIIFLNEVFILQFATVKFL